jgi:hypothetical protein
MNDVISEPIQIGKAVLADNKLTVDGMAYEIRHRDDFASFIQNTSAVVATALATVFPSNTGVLTFDAGEAGSLKHSDAEPWEQYSASTMGFSSDPSLANVVIGWCALLCVHSHFKPNEHVELKAIDLARYIAFEAYKAAYASPEAVQRWDLYQAQLLTVESIAARLEGTDDAPENPWDGAVDLWLPAPSGLTDLTALSLVNAFAGDIVVNDGKAWAGIGKHHFMACLDDVSHVKGTGTFGTKLTCGGVERRFRCDSRGNTLVLRLLASAIPALGDSPFSNHWDHSN